MAADSWAVHRFDKNNRNNKYESCHDIREIAKTCRPGIKRYRWPPVRRGAELVECQRESLKLNEANARLQYPAAATDRPLHAVGSNDGRRRCSEGRCRKLPAGLHGR